MLTTEAMIADWVAAFAFLLLPFYFVSGVDLPTMRRSLFRRATGGFDPKRHPRR
jgi:hypothetical protein